MTTNHPTLGFIGLGAMGGHMVASLLQAGYSTTVFDLDETRIEHAVSKGASPAKNIAHLVAQSDVILTSLPSSNTFVTVAQKDLLPHIRSGQTVIDFGTVTPLETRRLAALFADKDAYLIDSPVSGGPGGAETARLYMFVGGDPDVVEKYRPILETVGGSELLTYCGPAGSGQVVKGVNQLMMGLANAAYLEAIAFGVNDGVDAAIIEKAIGNQGRWRADFHGTAQKICEGEGNEVGVKFRELPYFLAEAAEQGFPLPLTDVLRAFCEPGDRIVIDDHRPAPSFWHELTTRTESK